VPSSLFPSTFSSQRIPQSSLTALPVTFNVSPLSCP
jgi:hypothetical protein